MKTKVNLVGGRIEINLGGFSIALVANPENEKLARDISVALNQHAALVAVVEAAKAAQAMARARGLHFDGLDSALAQLAAVQGGAQ